jgi:hypothetical protein
MEHKLTVTVPDEVYQPLVQEALRQGRTPEEWAAERLSQTVPRIPAFSDVADEQEAEERFARHIGAWDSGDQNSADNDRIDADLAREYANC